MEEVTTVAYLLRRLKLEEVTTVAYLLSQTLEVGGGDNSRLPIESVT